ncbi:MAG TPA: hypothetical protein V6C97_01670 [Oculatellaceae cyanobacterium]
MHLKIGTGLSSAFASVVLQAVCGPLVLAASPPGTEDGVLNKDMVKDIAGAMAKKSSPLSQADTLAGQGRWADAYDAYTTEINLHRDNSVSPRVKRMVCAARLKRWNEVIADGNEILKAKSPGPQKRAKVLQRRAEAYAALKKYELARVDLLEEIKLWPDSRPAYVDLIKVYQASGDWQGVAETQKKLDALDTEIKPF